MHHARSSSSVRRARPSASTAAASRTCTRRSLAPPRHARRSPGPAVTGRRPGSLDGAWPAGGLGTEPGATGGAPDRRALRGARADHQQGLRVGTAGAGQRRLQHPARRIRGGAGRRHRIDEPDAVPGGQHRRALGPQDGALPVRRRDVSRRLSGPAVEPDHGRDRGDPRAAVRHHARRLRQRSRSTASGRPRPRRRRGGSTTRSCR